jgi:hypothetical protein
VDRLLRLVLAGLLLAAATVFVIGVAVERNQGDRHTEASPGTTEGNGETGGHVEGGAEPVAGETTETSTEKLFGIDTESTPVVAAFVAVSVLLAAAVLLSGAPALLAIVALFGFAATAFDIREVIHQIDESRETVVAQASITAGLHLLVGLVAVAGLLAPPTRRPAPAAQQHQP